MPEPIPFESFYDLRLLGDLAVSPDGDRVAFVADEFDAEEDDRRSSLFVVPADGSRPPHRLTRASDGGSPKWSPDGSKLGFVAAREEDVALAVVGEDDEAGGDEGSGTGDDEDETTADGDEDETTADGGEDATGGGDEPKPQLWVFDLERGGDARQVTDRDEGVREFDWAPDGERVVVSARDPTDEEAEYLERRREDDGPIVTERVQHKLNGVGWQDTVTTYLFVVDLEGREGNRLDEAYGGGALEGQSGLQPAWGDGGIAFLSNRVEDADESIAVDGYLVQPDGSGLEQITDTELVVRKPVWRPDGDDLAFVAGHVDDPARPAEVYRWDGRDYRSLTGALDRTVARGGALRWTDDGALLASIGDEAQTKVFRVAAEGGAEQVLESQGPYESVRTFDLHGGTLALAVTHPSAGFDLHALDACSVAAGDPDRRRLTDLNGEFRDAWPMPDCRWVTFESDGHELDGLVYAPPGADLDADDPRPVVVSIHGGPMSYDEPEFSFEYACWTSRGYLVFCPNYRGGTSYGRAFASTLVGAWGTAEVDDVVAGVGSLVERGWADADRVFGRGFSYGGIAQGFLVARTDLFTAAAPEHGIYDLRADFGTSDAHNWTERDFGLPWEHPDAYEAASSITDAGDIETPLLVAAGGRDWRCPSSQSEQLYISAKKAGAPAKLVIYPDEHHTVGDPDRAVHRLEQLEAWYERHDPAAPADGSAPGDA